MFSTPNTARPTPSSSARRRVSMWSLADASPSKRTMRGIFCWLSCFLLLTGQMFAAEPLDWAFIGVWDRSMPQVEAACRENGIHAEFFKGQKFNETQKPE